MTQVERRYRFEEAADFRESHDCGFTLTRFREWEIHQRPWNSGCGLVSFHLVQTNTNEHSRFQGCLPGEPDLHKAKELFTAVRVILHILRYAAFKRSFSITNVGAPDSLRCEMAHDKEHLYHRQLGSVLHKHCLIARGDWLDRAHVTWGSESLSAHSQCTPLVQRDIAVCT